MSSRKFALTLGSLLALSTLRVLAQDTAPPAEPVHEIQMTAKKYEFNPSTITVKKGERVRLILTALDKDHGIKIDAFKIDQILKKGSPATVEFTADKAGEFPFECSKFCGFGHGRMKGKLVVEE